MKNPWTMASAMFWSTLFLGWWYFLTPVMPPTVTIRLTNPIDPLWNGLPSPTKYYVADCTTGEALWSDRLIFHNNVIRESR